MIPLSYELLEEEISNLEIKDLTTATIRQICTLSAALEKAASENFVHLELGNPGLPPEQIGIEAECRALREGVAGKYPDVNGIPRIKKAGSEFVKAFLNLDIPPKCIVPTVGSMQACYTLLTLLKQRIPEKDTILFFYPGFPAQTHQAKMLGLKTVSFDIHDIRGEAMRQKLDEILSSGKVTAMIYSNPNNPAWTNFTEEELKIIGEAASTSDAIVLEDLAYLGMDFRKNCSVPYQEPYFATVAKYTDNYILLISASKIFSYAGQRIAIVCMSPEVFNRRYPVLEKFYEMPNFGECYIYGVLYTASSGTAHSAQHAMSAMLEKATEGVLNFVDHTSDYGRRGAQLKDLFLRNGFHLVYDEDCGEEISDGFFFTVGYKDMGSEELQKELLRFGISSISLPSTGSTLPGVRVCVSMVNGDEILKITEQRLSLFNDSH